MTTFWDRIAFAYDAAESLNKKVYTAMLNNIADLLPPGGTVLECAAGTGAISLAVAPKASRVLCTDLSGPMLNRARKKAERAGLSNISFAQRNLLHLPEEDNSFDAVIAANVIHLLPEPKVALNELWRVTKSGGLLIVPTFLTQSGSKGFVFLVKCYKLLGFKPAHNFTAEEYRKLFINSGLPEPQLTVVKGRIPVGMAVFKKE